MSVILLQFGQCGNQIGDMLYSTVSEDIDSKDSATNGYNRLAINKWFETNKQGKWEPRSISIDVESKVVQFRRTSSFVFKNVIAKSYGGSANNWAYGYTERSKLLKSEVLDAVRKEVEKCDYVSSFLNIYSSSGGTGSGVGSSIIEILREIYPNKNIVNGVVLPYVKGEVVTQSYNSLLTLSHLYSIADSIILFENERMHYTCKYSQNIDNVNFSNINTIIAQQLAAVYQPVGDIDNISLLNHLTSHYSYKYLQIRSEPQIFKENMKYEATRQWKALVMSVSKQSRFDFLYQKELKIRNRIVSNTLITRGSDCCSDLDIKSLRETDLYVPWLTKSARFNMYHQERNFLNYDKHVTVVSNSNRVCFPLNLILEDAWNMFTHGAYMHHYKKYGIDEDFFLNSFQNLENILNDYKSL